MHTHSAAPSAVRRVAAAVNARRYVIACVCLLIAAAALRFYDLSASSLWHDEAIAAINSRGSLAEVVVNVRGRYSNTAPALYPMMMWAIQKAQESEFSARVMPATASVLTVGALLFWMPRLGVARRAAFLAALLAAVSAAAIEHAQDAREYSVDAFLAALLIAGTLQYARNGGKALLCGALFAAPLLQYGLALFGVAALGAAALAPIAVSPTPIGGVRRAFVAAVLERLKSRGDLLLPMGAFAAGCGASWALAARYQLKAGGWGQASYLADFYYQGGLNAAALVEFAFNRTWSLLIYHMPTAIAVAALVGLCALLPSLLRRRRLDALALLCTFAIGTALCAAALDFYPLGGSRHNLYLGPLIFLAAGGAFHALADNAASLARRAWVAPAFCAAAAVCIALAGAAAVRQSDVYGVDTGIERVIAALDARMQEGDAVYVSRWKVPAFEFYKNGRPADYFYGKAVCWGPSSANWAECVPKVLDEMFRLSNNYRRIWFVHNTSASVSEEMAAHSPRVKVEEVDFSGGTPLRDRKIDVWIWPQATLQLITGFDEVAERIRGEWLDAHGEAASGAPSAASTYNLYIHNNALHYGKRPCAPEDTDARFFLHIYPQDAADLPAPRRRYGFDNLDFDFHDHGLAAGDRCVIRRALPAYPIERILAGQFIHPNGPRVWEAEFPFEP